MRTDALKHRIRKRPVIRVLHAPVAVLAGMFLSACVGSTLDTTSIIDSRTAAPPPVTTSELALSEEDQRTQRLRSEAIAQIRSKAEAAPINEEAPAYGLPRQGETTLLTPSQIADKTRQLNETSRLAQNQVVDAELLARQRKMAELRRKGALHYQSALKKIESQ